MASQCDASSSATTTPPVHLPSSALRRQVHRGHGHGLARCHEPAPAGGRVVEQMRIISLSSSCTKQRCSELPPSSLHLPVGTKQRRTPWFLYAQLPRPRGGIQVCRGMYIVWYIMFIFHSFYYLAGIFF
jgi:hypothetical protein